MLSCLHLSRVFLHIVGRRKYIEILLKLALRVKQGNDRLERCRIRSEDNEFARTEYCGFHGIEIETQANEFWMIAVRIRDGEKEICADTCLLVIRPRCSNYGYK